MAIEALIYLLTYGQYAATPGNSALYPSGWWGYWDQSHYLRSAHALNMLGFRASEHWYPFGYALLGAPFASGTHGHVYLLPDLACLLAAMGAFVFACRRLQIGEVLPPAMFMFATLGMLTVSGLGDGVWPEGAPAEMMAVGWPCFIKSKKSLLF